ncbi:Hypothetical protein PHPALM_4223 [Phytophthora palmivora]|uniref:Uncharacterized protein n=1 Tax=Phytophthora palmivora TaxID=4796 RepID=A0A2P4YKC5_9STRA|nr:Hypothetical protein PHPALM_4223 [Phytophthora palmivora]
MQPSRKRVEGSVDTRRVGTVRKDIRLYARGNYRSQATSKRLRQETRTRQCPAKVRVGYVMFKVVEDHLGSYWEIAAVISKCTLEHNHRLIERDFRHDPSKRLMLDDNNLRTVEVLRKAGTKKLGIFKYIKENSASNPTIQDVHNLVRALKKREEANGPSDSSTNLIG